MRGLTNEAAWIWCNPVSASASISLILSAVPIGPGSIWNPSRGPSSWMSTCVGRSLMVLILGENGLGHSASLYYLPHREIRDAVRASTSDLSAGVPTATTHFT